MSNSPFDRVNLGFDGLFGPKTMFYHLQPTANHSRDHAELMERIQVPVLDLEKIEWLESGTVIVIVAGFLWVLWKLIRIGKRSDLGQSLKIRASVKAKRG